MKSDVPKHIAHENKENERERKKLESEWEGEKEEWWR